MSNFHLFTMMYGSHYIELFRRACFKSINWPLNRAAVEKRVWNIYTKRDHFEELGQLFKDSPFELRLYEITDSMRVAGCGFVKTSQCDGGVILLNGLRDQIAYSIENKSKMLFCPPDTIFGDGSVPSLLAIGSGSGACVSVAHPRVLPSVLDEIDILGATRGAITNAQLVTMAFKHAHDSWKYGEVGHEKNNSFIGGISWRKLSDGLYSVCHRLPTVYLADFNGSDFDFFWGQVSFGGWDHRWPAENLIRQERQRYVGSSDAAFIVEITEWDKNVPPEVSGRPPAGHEDAYWNGHYHNGINRQTSVIFRGE